MTAATPIADEAGSIIGYTGPTGGSAGTYGYGPFGEPDVWTGLRYRYNGQIMIPEAQLYYYKARVYDPGLGRFLQTDPVGQAGGVNIYAYVGNDPLNFEDHNGLDENIIGSLSVNSNRNPHPEIDDLVVIGPFCLSCYVREVRLKSFLDQFNGFIPNLTSSYSQANEGASNPGNLGKDKICNTPLRGGGSIGGNVSKIREMAQLETTGNQTGGGTLTLGFWVGSVAPGGAWAERLGEPWGNLNFGATGRAAGIPLEILLRGAGAAEILEGITGRTGTGQKGVGNPFGKAPYGDTREGQDQIRAGYNAAC